MTLRIWRPKEGEMVTKTLDDKKFVCKQSSNLDLYVCGFMCTPFTPNGRKLAWQDEATNTFWSAIKTIMCLRPKVFILENVIAISNNKNTEIVDSALTRLKGYRFVKVQANASDYGIPQHRPRIFIVGFKDAVLQRGFLLVGVDVLKTFFELRLKRRQCSRENLNFHSFLSEGSVSDGVKTCRLPNNEEDEDEDMPRLFGSCCHCVKGNHRLILNFPPRFDFV